MRPNSRMPPSATPISTGTICPGRALSASDLIKIDTGLMERIERAAKLTIDDHIRDRFSYQSYNTARLQENFEILSRQIFLLKKTEPDITPSANILGRSVKQIVEATRAYCRSAKGTDSKALFASGDTVSGFSALDSIAELVISVLENTAHEFGGFEDKFWPMAREIWDATLPRFGAQPEGMDALQQRVTLKLIEKTRESMEGWYSPLPRLALALIGPYAPKGETAERSAFKICRDMFYRELKAYPAFQDGRSRARQDAPAQQCPLRSRNERPDPPLQLRSGRPHQFERARDCSRATGRGIDAVRADADRCGIGCDGEQRIARTRKFHSLLATRRSPFAFECGPISKSEGDRP